MIAIYCVRGNGDKEMNEIEDSKISSDFVAVKRGKYEIDKQWFFVQSQTLNVPFKKTTDSTAIMDDDIVEISDFYLGISGKRKVSGMVISGNKEDLSLSLETVNYKDPE